MTRLAPFAPTAQKKLVGLVAEHGPTRDTIGTLARDGEERKSAAFVGLERGGSIMWIGAVFVDAEVSSGQEMTHAKLVLSAPPNLRAVGPILPFNHPERLARPVKRTRRVCATQATEEAIADCPNQPLNPTHRFDAASPSASASCNSRR